MATVDSLLIKIQADLGDLRKELNKSKQLTSRAGRDMSSGLDKIKIAGANLTNQFNLLKTAIVGAGFGFLGFQVIRANREMEDLKITLNSVFGSAERGDSAFQFINEFAQRTPFDIQTLTRAFITLQGAGVSPTTKLLTQLGNASSVTTNKLQSFDALVKIVSRSVGGGLGLEELQILETAGIPIFKIFEEQLNITRGEIGEFGQTADGAGKLVKALLDSFDTKFPDAMAKASGNLSVQFSNLGIAVNNLFLEMGESGLNDAIKNATQSLTDASVAGRSLASVLGTTFGNVIGFISDNFANLAKVIGGLIAIKTISWAVGTARAFIQLGIAVATATRLTAVFSATFSLLLRISKGGIIGITALIAGLVTFREELGKAIEEIGEKFGGKLKKGLEDINDSILGFFGLKGGFDETNLSLEQLEKTFTGASKVVPTFRDRISKLNELTKKFAPAGAELNKQLKEIKSLLKDMEDNNTVGQFNANIADAKTAVKELEAQIKSSKPEFEALKNAVSSAGNRISESLAEAFISGKATLADFQDTFRLFVKELLAQALRLMVINKAINSILGIQGTSSALPTADFPTFASGGTVQRGQPTLVGERGAELFVPNTSGVIRNNHNTRSGIGGNTIVVNQNVNFATGITPTVRAEVINMLPLIKKETMSAVVDAKQRGGSFAQQLGSSA